jgi:hypothetical protein
MHGDIFSIFPMECMATLLVCGRMIDADKGAYGDILVMVNLNQIGAAAPI